MAQNFLSKKLKDFALSANAEKIETRQIDTPADRISPIDKAFPPLRVVPKLRNEFENAEEPQSHDQLKMPKQPQGYIKCPRYEFF